MKTLCELKNNRIQAIVCLSLIILFLFSLCACQSANGASPVQPAHEPEITEPRRSMEPSLSPAPEPTPSEQHTRKTCTVRVIYWLFGSEIYVIDTDGAYSFYVTPEICDSLSSFYDGSCPTELRMSGVLSKTEFEKLQTILSSIYVDGQMLPVIEPNESVHAFWEPIDIYISVDNSEEAYIQKNYTAWDGYPQKEYDDLIEFLKSLDPDSIILNR